MDVSWRVALLALAWLAGWWLCARVRRLPVVETTSREPCSVVVPARDEATTLPTLLAGLARQRQPAAETIVVDDHSADGTATVASEAGAQVIAADPLPDGWTGKASAIRQGAAAAHGDVVVLLDADVDPAPELLGRLSATYAGCGGLVSVQPYHRVARWWEHASAFFNLVAIMGVGIASPPWPRRAPIVAAFGPVVACRRADLLERIAHPSVRGAVLEDVQLARRFAAAGEPVHAFGGRGVVSFRMYERPGALVEGWTKNFASGAGSVPLVRVLLIVAWVAACLSSGVWLFGGSLAAIVAFVAFAVQCFVQLRQVGSFGVVTAVLYPLLALVFVVVFVGSLVLTLRGEAHWKGRRVRLRQPRGAG